MKTLKHLLNDSVGTYQPKTPSEKRFVQKHFGEDGKPIMAPGFEGPKDRAGNPVDGVYQGAVKTAPRPGHGYAAAPSEEDEKVYEGKTFRRGSTEKRKAGASVKQFLRKKRDKDDRRLQETDREEFHIEIPDDEEVVELCEKSNEPDVRALRGQIVHKQFVGIVGTATEQNHYVVQDNAKRRFHLFTNKALGEKNDMCDVFVHEYKKGSGILTVAKKNMVKEDLDEVTDKQFQKSVDNDPNHPVNAAHRRWENHLQEAHQHLTNMSNILEQHEKAVKAPAGGPPEKHARGKANWHHAETLKKYVRQLSDLHDDMAGKGYTQGGEHGLQREETETQGEDPQMNLADKFVEMMGEELAQQIVTAYAELEDEHKETLLDMIEAEQWEELAALFTEEETDQE